MSAVAAYRTSDPEAISEWEAAHGALDAYRDRLAQALDDLGVGQYLIGVSTSGWSPGQFLGLKIPEDQFAPAGWRMAERANLWIAVPDKRTRIGKAAYAALEALAHPGSPRKNLRGMPFDVYAAYGDGTGRVFTPGADLLGGVLYVTWSTDPETAQDRRGRCLAQVDSAIWERVRLSEYHAALEANASAVASA